MLRLRLIFPVLLIGAVLSSLPIPAVAQQRMSLGYAFDGILEMSEMKCAEIGDMNAAQLEKEGKKAEEAAMRGARKNLCVCMPAKVRELQARLPPETLHKVLTEDEIKSNYMMKIIGSCGAEQLIDSFSDGCISHFSETTKPPPTYCSCMQDGVRKFSDVDLAQLGLDSADWIPRAAAAKKSGEPEPEMTPMLQRMKAIDTACRGKQLEKSAR